MLPSVHTVLLRLTQEGHRTIARWKIPWAAVIFTVLIAFGSVTAGILYGYSVDRIGKTETGLMLGFVWLLLVPIGGVIAFRVFRRAMTRRKHLVLDVAAREFTVACLDHDDEVIPFDQAEALVHVSRMIETGHGGRLWQRVDEFSVVFTGSDGACVQLPLYAIQDSGKRQETLRRWTNELPRVLGCQRVRVAFNRKGQLQESGSDD
jgi:hypothetical protein